MKSCAPMGTRPAHGHPRGPQGLHDGPPAAAIVPTDPSRTKRSRRRGMTVTLQREDGSPGKPAGTSRQPACLPHRGASSLGPWLPTRAGSGSGRESRRGAGSRRRRPDPETPGHAGGFGISTMRTYACTFRPAVRRPSPRDGPAAEQRNCPGSRVPGTLLSARSPCRSRQNPHRLPSPTI